MSNFANLALEGNDPRDPAHPIVHSNEPVENQLMRERNDPSVTFEEYMYYGAITRAEEKSANAQYVEQAGPKTVKSVFKNRFSKGRVESAPPSTDAPGLAPSNEKTDLDISSAPGVMSRAGVSDAEIRNASRAIRTAGWSSVFYLITTDILGPFSTP